MFFLCESLVALERAFGGHQNLYNAHFFKKLGDCPLISINVLTLAEALGYSEKNN